jgi:acetyl-CoA/propionyl-CoA carboxylase biotin carboxyl carrier protein
VTGPLRFERLLVANRGEIAARVFKAARSLGLSTVAVYSEADRAAPYLGLADSALAIGGAAPAESYLNIPALIEAARRASATAVHPGYGFLSENAGFARAVGEAGLVFVGPPAQVIEEMSRKDAARKIAKKAGLRVLAAAEGGDDEELVGSVLAEVGFPALIKAVAGGGGKAMHVVKDEPELRSALASAHREAVAAFGDPALYVEGFVEHGRHIEVQVVADEHANVVHLFERDCSVQRRHQKVIEEAPAPGISQALRDRLCADAVRLASCVGYRNVGTVEFLVSGEAAWFLEMNTRLQVEHRVTEAVTGIDLVRLQLEIAQGRPLPFSQSEVACRGCAIEARLYAEDPEAGFLPLGGTPNFVWFPADALVDAAVSEGRAVTTFYDPMLAKIVVTGPSRAAARKRLVRALDDSAIFGLKTNLGFCRSLVASEDFAEASIDINALDKGLFPSGRDALVALPVAAEVIVGHGSKSPLGDSDGWRIGGPPAPVKLSLSADSVEHVVVVDRKAGTVSRAGRTYSFTVLERSGDRLRCSVDGVVGLFHFAADHQGVTVGHKGWSYRFDLSRPSASSSGARLGGDLICAPMPGVVLEIEARTGSRVREGDVLVLVESMKMEFPLRAPRDGVVAEVLVAKGDHVDLDAPLVRLEPPAQDRDEPPTGDEEEP